MEAFGQVGTGVHTYGAGHGFARTCSRPTEPGRVGPIEEGIQMGDELLDTGREIQGRLWPQMRTAGARFPAARLAPDFYRWVAESAFGMIWSRPGLPVRDRSLVTVAQLAALGRTEELRAHLAGALNVGLTRDELVEVLMQTAVYAGVPAANEALRVAADVLGDGGDADG
jgi:4-carboxymuconolactone decarboxylase